MDGQVLPVVGQQIPVITPPLDAESVRQAIEQSVQGSVQTATSQRVSSADSYMVAVASARGGAGTPRSFSTASAQPCPFMNEEQ